MLAQNGVLISQRPEEMAWLEFAQSCENVQGMQTPEVGFTLRSKFGQGGNHLQVLPLEKQPGGGFTTPCIGCGENGHQFAGGGFRQAGRSRANELLGHDPPNAPAIIAAVKVDVPLDPRWQRPWVFDHFAIHVQDI